MKILTLVLLVAFAVFMAITPVYAADTARILFSQQGKLSVNKTLKVDVIVDSSTHVNAAQVTILYPQDQFSLQRVDSTNSKFTIQADEQIAPGSVTVARGNVTPLRGKNLLVSLLVTPIKSTSSVKNFSFDPSKSLIMSTKNVNILTGSQVLTVKPYTETSTEETGVISLVTRTVKEFFNGLFGRK